LESGWLGEVLSFGAAAPGGSEIDEAAGAEAGTLFVPKALATEGCCWLGVDAVPVVLLAVEDWAAWFTGAEAATDGTIAASGVAGDGVAAL
jgi:hypothetical protein